MTIEQIITWIALFGLAMIVLAHVRLRRAYHRHQQQITIHQRRTAHLASALISIRDGKAHVWLETRGIRATPKEAPVIAAAEALTMEQVK